MTIYAKNIKISHGILCHWTFLLGHRSNLHCHSSPEQETIPPFAISPSPVPSSQTQSPHRSPGVLGFHPLQGYSVGVGVQVNLVASFLFLLSV